MLKKLLDFEDFCESHLDSDTNLTSEDWENIKKLVTILEPLYISTLKLQSEQLYLGDFYKHWVELKLTVESASPRSNILENCLKKREQNIIENPIIVSAIYLDPRIR